MEELKSGLILANRYTLVRRLGTGGSTEVWLGSDRMTRASVALKLCVRGGLDPRLLRREWQLAIRLMHPHIVRVFEFHEPGPDSGGAHFFSMQFIDGPQLGVLSGAPATETLGVAVLLADALDYLHGKGVVHRDIKAANVLVDHNGAPYLVDFGVAANGMERPGGGSLIAMSPQQLAGEEPQSADDIFAFGGMLFELLAGRSPWSSAATESDIRAANARSLHGENVAGLPAGIAELIADMLQKDPAARPAAAEVAQRIEAAGVTSAPVPAARLGTVRGNADEVIDTGIAPARVRAGARDAVQDESVARTRDGLTPRTVGIAMIVLIALLFAVVFLLPELARKPDEADAPAAASSPEPAAVPDAEAEPSPGALPQRDERVQARAATEEVLGRLLAKVRTLEGRAVERWGGVAWRSVQTEYQAGDDAYLAGDYAAATAHYEAAIGHVDPLLDRVDNVFAATLDEARSAFDDGDSIEAVRLFELAVAISPGHAGAKAGLERARNLDRVLELTEQGISLERDLEFSAAKDSFARAVEIDPDWEEARLGLARVEGTINQMAFDARMSEGLAALAEGNYAVARAAFRVAQELQPGSTEPADGLLQVEQGTRLGRIGALEQTALAQEEGEEWSAASETYEQLLELDDTLTFAHEGLARSRAMIALHEQLNGFIENPDSLSADSTMQRATRLLVDVTRMQDIGPRLAGERDELSRLLKRAATPLTVQLVSDDKTSVSIYKVGRLGTFAATELSLRPGTYVAVGSRPGYRDVRLEFRVSPESEMQPVVVRCEEQI